MIQRLNPDVGDTVEVSVTHEIKIDGEKSWVGTRYATKIRDNETSDEAHQRADAKVQEWVIQSVNSAVAHVIEENTK